MRPDGLRTSAPRNFPNSNRRAWGRCRRNPGLHALPACRRQAELVGTFQRRMRLGSGETCFHRQPKIEREAAGRRIMDDPPMKGRGARMASEGEGHGSEAADASRVMGVGSREKSPNESPSRSTGGEAMPAVEDSRSEPSGHSGGEQRRARRASNAPPNQAAKDRCEDRHLS